MKDYEYTAPDRAERRHLYKRLALRGVLLVLLGCFVLYGLPAMLPFLMPFLVALLVAMALNPLVNLLERKLHIGRRVSALVLTVLVVSALVLVLAWVFNTIISESISLAASINADWSTIENSIALVGDKLAWLDDFLPGQANILDTVTDSVYAWLQSASSGIMESAVSVAATVTSKVSSIVISLTMTLLAMYFTIADYPKMTAFVNRHTERRLFQMLQKIKWAVQSALGGVVKSQLLLALLAFVVMFAALALYGQPYSLLIAIGLGIVDFLPIVGTIAVLIPWALIEYIGGNAGKALFLLILGVGFFVLRKIMEPKIVGSQTGLHPLAALASIYAGLKISGIWGAILGPVVAMIAVNIYRSGIFENTIRDFKDLYHLGMQVLKRDSGD